MTRLLVYLPSFNDKTFLLCTFRRESAVLRDYSDPIRGTATETPSSRAKIEDALKETGAKCNPAPTHSTDDYEFWHGQTMDANKELRSDGSSRARSSADVPVSSNKDTSDGRSQESKGSKYWIRKYVNEEEKRKQLKDEILLHSPSLMAFAPQSLEWMSPLENKSFTEDKNSDVLRRIGDATLQRKLRQFWPPQGQNWDATAMVHSSSSKSGVLLVEAKAHCNETKSDCQAKGEGRRKITDSLKRAQEFMAVPKTEWRSGVYQLGNRLAFLYFLTQIAGVQAWLVLVNFVNDRTHKPTSRDQWAQHYLDVIRRLGIHADCRLLDRIVMVFPDVSNELPELKGKMVS